ncbi:MAG: YceI family protein [Actinobacteria bacterium]|nr:YceI family protein [Actinomycetota bacterium]
MSVTTETLTGRYAADPIHSFFGFTLKHMKVASFSARFDDVAARVISNEQGLSLDGTVGVESVSIRTPREFRDHVVYSAEFFDAKTYPEIAFRSSDIDLAADGTATVRGELTIKDVTKPFVAAGTYQPPVEDPFGSTRVAAEFTEG